MVLRWKAVNHCVVRHDEGLLYNIVIANSTLVVVWKKIMALSCGATTFHPDSWSHLVD